MHIDLIKSTALDAIAAAAQPGERPWPVAPARIAAWCAADATHARALQLKAEGIASGGITGPAADRALELLGGAAELIECALDLETYGNLFLERVKDGRGRLAALRRLPAWSMALKERDGFRQRVWNGQKEVVTDYAPDEVAWLKLPTVAPGWYGQPSWIAAAGVIELLDAITRYNTRFFEHNAVPDHLIKVSGGSLTDAQKEAIRSFFQSEFKGLANSRKTLFVALSEGQTLEITPVAQPNDGKFIELYKTAREVLPAAHGVPPRLLGIATPGALGGLSEVAQQMHMFETFTLAPRRRLLAGFLRRETGLDIDLAVIDLTPPGQDIAALPPLIAAGVMTPDEARAWIDLPVTTQKSAEIDGELAAALLAAMGG